MSSLHVHGDVLERKTLEPDPGVVKSLGTHHTLDSAIADLIDNSIDAGADRVLVRFDTDGGQPTGLRVIDNGRGMDGHQADEAMRLGRQRQYAAQDQGHFGIGLKAASFSHADTLTVTTLSADGDLHCRRLHRDTVQRDFGCDVVDPAMVRDGFEGLLGRIAATAGTVVHWSDTRFPQISTNGLNHWLEESKTQLRMHLGLVYHRLLASQRLRIDVEVFDVALDRAGFPEPITPVDPLQFPASAISGYPRSVYATVHGHKIPLTCHLLPPKYSGPQFRLYGKDGSEFQGFFIYRNDRLLQAGGWNHVTGRSKDRALARVVLDDFPAIADLVRLNPEKSGIAFTHELQAGIAEATGPDGFTFADYLGQAESVLTDSRRRQHKRRPIAEPSKGLHEDVRRVIRAEVPLRTEEGPVEIRWEALPRDRFFRLDREGRVIYLNKYYRQMLTGGVTGLSDAPLVKTLMFLLAQEHFTGQQWGSRDRDLLDMWTEILGKAAQTEQAYREEASR